MNVKDKVWLKNAIVQLNNSNASAYKFVTNKDNCNKILALISRVGKPHLNKTIDELKERSKHDEM